MRAIPDSATMIANLEGGTLDLIAAPPASEFERLEAAEGIKVVKGFPGGLVWDMSLNVRDASPSTTSSFARRSSTPSIASASLTLFSST